MSAPLTRSPRSPSTKSSSTFVTCSSACVFLKLVLQVPSAFCKARGEVQSRVLLHPNAGQPQVPLGYPTSQDNPYSGQRVHLPGPTRPSPLPHFYVTCPPTSNKTVTAELILQNRLLGDWELASAAILLLSSGAARASPSTESCVSEAD